MSWIAGALGHFTRAKALRAFVPSHDWSESSVFWSRAITPQLVERLIDTNICMRMTQLQNH
jgi:hypothetical protein